MWNLGEEIHDRGPVHGPRTQDDDHTREADLPRLHPRPRVRLRGEGHQLPPGGPGPAPFVCHQAAADELQRGIYILLLLTL